MATRHTRNFLFPPPAYITMPAVGIDISDRSIKYAELLPSGTSYRLGRFGEVSLEPGIVENGRIVTPTRLTQALATLSQEQHLTFVRAALPEEQIYFFLTHVPDGPRRELSEAIELGLEDHVPIPAAETVFDFEIMGHSGADAEVLVTAAPRAIIQSYADTFRAAGLTLLSLELEAEAVSRAVVHGGDATAYLLVDFGQTRTGIAVVYDGKVHFTSTVSAGGQMLTDILTKNFGISAAEAEAMKREYGILRNTPKQDLFSLLLNNVAVLRDEINKHFVYWHTHLDDGGMHRPPIEEIVLVGGASNLAGLPDYLSASLHVKVTVGNVWTNVVLPKNDVPQISRNDSLGYATSIGLALHDTNYDQMT